MTGGDEERILVRKDECRALWREGEPAATITGVDVEVSGVLGRERPGRF